MALSTRPGLGTSPITSLPYVMTFALPLTLGTAAVIINLLFIVVQFVILKKFQYSLLWQLPTLLVFGFFIDLGMWATSCFVPENYCLRILEELFGCAVLALGIGFLLIADISFMPGDGLIRTISQVYKIPFGTVKICFDITIVLSAIIFSLCVFHNITGIREGTLIAAIAVGLLVKVYHKPLQKLKNYLLK